MKSPGLVSYPGWPSRFLLAHPPLCCFCPPGRGAWRGLPFTHLWEEALAGLRLRSGWEWAPAPREQLVTFLQMTMEAFAKPEQALMPDWLGALSLSLSLTHTHTHTHTVALASEERQAPRLLPDLISFRNSDTTISQEDVPGSPRQPESQIESPQAAAAETPFMAILLAATRIAQPLARLTLKAPHCKDGTATGLRLLPEVRAAASAWRSQRCYATEVEEISQRPVLITGCDSGFGFSLAKFLHGKGFIIYAGCLLKEQGRGGSKDLDNMKSDRMRTVQLNVCDSEEVGRAVDYITSTLKDPETGGLWGLVNNAGISTFGEVEFTSMDTYKEVAEVNLWGTIRTTKAFLPLIRRAKGRVVNISSMMGRMANPARSPYCITKFGVEAFSDCLRYEMRPHDVKVCIVEPGNFIAGTSLYSPERIQSIADKMWDELPEIVRRDYGRKYFDEQIAKMESYCNSGSSDTSPVVESIGHALTSTTPYTRYHPMDYYWWLRMQVMTHMPAAISDRLYIY